MRLVWSEQAWSDYLHWQNVDRDMVEKINVLIRDTLIRDTKRSPFKGLGKPEPLKGVLTGWWSRRVTGEHRLVYRVTGKDDGQSLEIAACRYHY